MVKNNTKGSDGKYTIGGRKFPLLEGSRAQVWHENAYKTSGGLTRFDLIKNKHGRIVSRKKSMFEKKLGRLAKHGYTHKKNKFGAVKIGKSKGRSRTMKKRKTKKGGRK